jgi:hypothetical protein
MIKIWRSTTISMLEDNRKRENNSNTMDAGSKHFIEQNILQEYKVSRPGIDKRHKSLLHQPEQ